MPLSLNGSTQYSLINTGAITIAPQSVCIWVYDTKGNVNEWRAAVSRQDETYSYAEQFGLGYSWNRFGWVVLDTTGAGLEVNSTMLYNQWAHICGTCSSGGTSRLYVNGVETANGSFAGRTLNQSNNGIHIGANRNGTDVGEFWQGYLHDLRVYDRVLTAEEINTIYTTRGKDRILSGLRVRCPLSDGVGTATIKEIGPTQFSTTTTGSPSWYYPGVLRIA